MFKGKLVITLFALSIVLPACKQTEPLMLDNLSIVEQFYAGFAERDLPAVLETLAEDVDWQSPVSRSQPTEISWAKPRNSREEVATFFQELLGAVTPEKLETLEFTAEGNRVTVEGLNRGTVKSTGKAYEHDWIMVFTIEQGQIKRFRHYYDTSDLVVAFMP